MWSDSSRSFFWNQKISNIRPLDWSISTSNNYSASFAWIWCSSKQKPVAGWSGWSKHNKDWNICWSLIPAQFLSKWPESPQLEHTPICEDNELRANIWWKIIFVGSSLQVPSASSSGIEDGMVRWEITLESFYYLSIKLIKNIEKLLKLLHLEEQIESG